MQFARSRRRFARETLLGNVALRADTTIRWNATEGKTDQPQADGWLGRKYRLGWEW